MDNLYIKDLNTLSLIFENFYSRTGISKRQPYMYMYSDQTNNTDHFKHSLTRKYISVKGTWTERNLNDKALSHHQRS